MDVRVLKASYVKSILSATLPETPIELQLPYVDLSSYESQPSEDVEIERVTSWEDEVAREETVRAQKGRAPDLREPHTDRSMTPEQRQVSPWDKREIPDRPAARPNPWGRKPELRQSPERPTIPDRQNPSGRPNPWGRKPETGPSPVRDRTNPWGRKQEKSRSPPPEPRRSFDREPVSERRQPAERPSSWGRKPDVPQSPPPERASPLERKSEPPRQDTDPSTEPQPETLPSRDSRGRKDEVPTPDPPISQPIERPNVWGRRPAVQPEKPSTDSVERPNVWGRRPAVQPEKLTTPRERSNPWGRKEEKPKTSETDSESGLGLSGPQPVDVVQGAKHVKVKAYAQVASAKPTPAPTTQAENKTGSAMLTMSLKPRTATRN